MNFDCSGSTGYLVSFIISKCPRKSMQCRDHTPFGGSFVAIVLVLRCCIITHLACVKPQLRHKLLRLWTEHSELVSGLFCGCTRQVLTENDKSTIRSFGDHLKKIPSKVHVDGVFTSWRASDTITQWPRGPASVDRRGQATLS